MDDQASNGSSSRIPLRLPGMSAVRWPLALGNRLPLEVHPLQASSSSLLNPTCHCYVSSLARKTDASGTDYRTRVTDFCRSSFATILYTLFKFGIGSMLRMVERIVLNSELAIVVPNARPLLPEKTNFGFNLENPRMVALGIPFLEVVPQALGVHRICNRGLETTVHSVEHPRQNCGVASFPPFSEGIVFSLFFERSINEWQLVPCPKRNQHGS
ncbi:hypothetical protein CRG98_011530 [Punica granatum]|uniref:Uncharacterized protein n=1 Tax=Punica granatum TaxID=22663 RepID=A0A2I0KHF8_PUNGR|nr:hypothetical protein CRG98_011530 [Punica granatum]